MSLNRRVTASANMSPVKYIVGEEWWSDFYSLCFSLQKCNTLSPLKYRWWGAKIAVKMRPGQNSWSVSFVQLECHLIWWRLFLFHIGYKEISPSSLIQKYERRIAPQKHRQERVEWHLIWWRLFSKSSVPKTISGLSSFSVSWWMS